MPAFLTAVETHSGITIPHDQRQARVNLDDLLALARTSVDQKTGTRPNPHGVWGTLQNLEKRHH